MTRPHTVFRSDFSLREIWKRGPIRSLHLYRFERACLARSALYNAGLTDDHPEVIGLSTVVHRRYKRLRSGPTLTGEPRWWTYSQTMRLVRCFAPKWHERYAQARFARTLARADSACP